MSSEPVWDARVAAEPRKWAGRRRRWLESIERFEQIPAAERTRGQVLELERLRGHERDLRCALRRGCACLDCGTKLGNPDAPGYSDGYGEKCWARRQKAAEA